MITNPSIYHNRLFRVKNLYSAIQFLILNYNLSQNLDYKRKKKYVSFALIFLPHALLDLLAYSVIQNEYVGFTIV